MKELQNLLFEISETIYKMQNKYYFDDDDYIYMRGCIKDWKILLNLLKGSDKEW